MPFLESMDDILSIELVPEWDTPDCEDIPTYGADGGKEPPISPPLVVSLATHTTGFYKNSRS
jgi:hypothetical protein